MATVNTNGKALIFDSCVAPDLWKAPRALSGKLPASTLGQTLAPPINLAGGNRHLSIGQIKFHSRVAAESRRKACRESGDRNADCSAEADHQVRARELPDSAARSIQMQAISAFSQRILSTR